MYKILKIIAYVAGLVHLGWYMDFCLEAIIYNAPSQAIIHGSAEYFLPWVKYCLLLALLVYVIVWHKTGVLPSWYISAYALLGVAVIVDITSAILFFHEEIGEVILDGFSAVLLALAAGGVAIMVASIAEIWRAKDKLNRYAMLWLITLSLWCGIMTALLFVESYRFLNFTPPPYTLGVY